MPIIKAAHTVEGTIMPCLFPGSIFWLIKYSHYTDQTSEGQKNSVCYQLIQLLEAED